MIEKKWNNTQFGSNLDAETFDEVEARNPYDDNVYTDRGGYGNKNVLYVEHYLFYDLDGEQTKELELYRKKRLMLSMLNNGMTCRLSCFHQIENHILRLAHVQQIM